VPGRYTRRQSQSIFRNGVNPKLKQFLQTEGLLEKPIGPGSNCSNSAICQSRFIKYVSFLRKMNTLYPITYSDGEFLDQRPGKFLCLFVSWKQSLAVLWYPSIHPFIHPPDNYCRSASNFQPQFFLNNLNSFNSLTHLYTLNSLNKFEQSEQFERLNSFYNFNYSIYNVLTNCLNISYCNLVPGINQLFLTVQSAERVTTCLPIHPLSAQY
jgi:hypothetical protein